MNIRKASIPGCCEITPPRHSDHRGYFVKPVVASIFEANGLATRFVEQYYARSQQRVLRGLHFQLPPHHHDKYVFCTEGEVIDVLVDLRKGSPLFGKAEKFILSAEAANGVYIPAGIAHGYYVTSAYATLVYNVTSEYAPRADSGILWKSIDFPWPDPSPIVSTKDETFVTLADFVSPFTMVQ